MEGIESLLLVLILIFFFLLMRVGSDGLLLATRVATRSVRRWASIEPVGWGPVKHIKGACFLEWDTDGLVCMLLMLK